VAEVNAESHSSHTLVCTAGSVSIAVVYAGITHDIDSCVGFVDGDDSGVGSTVVVGIACKARLRLVITCINGAVAVGP
jgi:hypothetical protein